MAKHVEHEPTSQPSKPANQPTELTTEEMEGVSGGLKFEMSDVKITSNQLGSSQEPTPK